VAHRLRTYAIVRNGISSRLESLHHFWHRTKHQSRHFNHANYTNPFPVYFHFRFLQINANTALTLPIVVLCRVYTSATCCSQHATCCGQQASCCAQQVACCPQQVACCAQHVASSNKLRATSNKATCCAGVNAALHCYQSILANTKFPFSQCNLVSRLYELRSVRNLHRRIALLRAEEEVYNVDLLRIKGSKVIGCQNPKILTHDLVEPRDPLGPRYELTPDLHVSRQSTRESGPPRVMHTI